MAQRDGNRHVRSDLLRRRSDSSGNIYSKVSPARRPRPPIPAGIQDKICLMDRVRRQVTRGPALRAEVNRLQRLGTRRIEWRNYQWIGALESLDAEDQSL